MGELKKKKIICKHTKITVKYKIITVNWTIYPSCRDPDLMAYSLFIFLFSASGNSRPELGPGHPLLGRVLLPGRVSAGDLEDGTSLLRATQHERGLPPSQHIRPKCEPLSFAL